ncbi:hypothetical protein BGZ61DRAFT_539772 [Ilyonectria robusta]|uniref:uncharacterized protein n=1 Tax=Ilyonectria robusta TaxID=1079257 RepID=UPI001E8CBBCB|nr:uncharacterized protein BGZ61DRAFT_539772 [Ilyonectria robusta]KAH8661116.1 hypothetical protein BGZ61DRAFT_539772 [Ilyonectria robusta]
MAPAQVKGDIPTHGSTFIKHLLNYPVFKDGDQKADEYGQKSIQLGNSAYKTFAAPVLPALVRQAHRADELGDNTLNRIDERFPIVKKPTSELYNEAKGLILLPYTKGLKGKDHVLQVYSTEYNKNEQAGLVADLVAHGKAVFTTILLVSNETLSWLSSFVSAKKAEATQKVNDKINQ